MARPAPARASVPSAPHPEAGNTPPFLERWQERGATDERDHAAPEKAATPSAESKEHSGSELNSLDSLGPGRVRISYQLSDTSPVSRAGPRLKYWGMVAGAAALIALIVGASTLLARLTVTVKPRIEDVAVQDIAVGLDAAAAKALPAQKTIPAETLSFSKKTEQSFSATGKARVAARARGIVKITNRFSAVPQPLVASTRFLTEGGVLFRLPKSIVVPGAKVEGGKIVPQSVEAELVADVPGERSNIAGETNLMIPGFQGTPKYEKFDAVAAQGFSGGLEGTGTVVSKDDIKNAEEQVTKAVFDVLKAEIGRGIPPGFVSADGLQNVQIVKVDAPAPGTRAEHFSVAASAIGKALIFREQDAVALVQSLVLAGAADQEFVQGSAQLRYQARSADFGKGKAELAVSGHVKTRAVAHADDLAALIAGKKMGSITDVLRNRHELADFHLSFFPPWRSSAPANPAKIHITVAGQ